MWEELGQPRIPCLLLDGQVVRILQVSQIASALDLPMPEVGSVKRLAWDIVPVLESWLEILPTVDWDYALTPSQSRERSIRNLTVNAFHPFELLPVTWTSREFDWNPELTDVGMEQPLDTLEKLIAFAQKCLIDWQSFLLDMDEELQGDGPEIDTPRGRVTFNVIVAGQRFHAAWHYRQIVDHLRLGRFEVKEPLDVEAISADLTLPAYIYSA